MHLGTVRPGSTIYIPFHTFDSNDPSASVTITGLATTDIEIYKNGSNTTRASDSGYTLLGTDGIDEYGTGIHGVSIDLADNTTAGFFTAGAFYHVVIASITVDAATVNFIAATFFIGYEDAIINTTIATLASQTSFTLTVGPAEADVLNGMPCIIHDVASAVQIAKGIISDYAVTTKTVTLDADPGVFTMAAGDNISIFIGDALNPTARANIESAGDNYSATRGLSGTALPAAAADAAGGLPISDAGGLDLDTMNANVSATLTDTAEIGAAGAGLTEAGGTGDHLTAINLPDQTMNITGDITGNLSGSVGSVTGAVGSVTAQVSADVTAISGDSAAADYLEAIADGGIIGQVNDAAATTTAFAADGFTEATDDHFNGRLITFISGALTGQQTDITDYDAAGHVQGNQAFVVTALTEAPANDDFFVVH